MGISWSGRRRNNYIQNPPAYYYPPESHPPPPPLPPPPPPQGYFPPSTAPYCTNYGAAPSLPPPPPQTHSLSFYYSTPNGFTNYANSTGNRLHYHPHPFYQPQPQPVGWTATRSSPSTPPPYVDHQTAKKIRNYVNVHKDTLRLEVDQDNPDHHLVSFVFDAVYDGSPVNSIGFSAALYGSFYNS
ncbi:putative E3 ubiquitin-protein ligase LUL4, partial [Mucuna pruriens]